ncbi:hypothetical protein A0H81_12378 [Grifola frondosa]|uniref:Uncharacterized protein n=1 Tax=Grifola frondosa TaxID=5627 RepID=A0A1C7LSD9_GRIFR|nr:hypothetical protein A0H81_12378 [Grifola frondosa]
MSVAFNGNRRLSVKIGLMEVYLDCLRTQTLCITPTTLSFSRSLSTKILSGTDVHDARKCCSEHVQKCMSSFCLLQLLRQPHSNETDGVTIVVVISLGM